MGAIANRILRMICGWLEQTSSEQTAQQYLRNRFQTLAEEHAAVASNPTIRRDLRNAARLMQQIPGMAGWTGVELLSLPDAPRTRPTGADKQAVAEATRWLTQLPNQQLVNRGVVQRDAGARLESVDAAAFAGRQVSPSDALEAMLRHVELRRNACLREFDPPLYSQQDIWLQRHDVSILLSRHARRAQDIRFLNAALKLNDWAIGQRGQQVHPLIGARLVLALAEQEYSILDWSRPCELPSSRPSVTASTRDA